jgi:hypothetical protein
MVEGHVAAGDARPGTERDAQKNDWEQAVPHAEDDRANACRKSYRSNVFGADAGAGLT